MSKICPLSMSSDTPKPCKESKCNGWVNEECYLNRQTLSQYFITRNLGDICYELERIGGEEDDSI